MATHYDRIIVTEQSAGRLSAWHKHRCARVAKKYEDAFVVSRAACRQRPVEVIEHVRHLGEEAGIRLTVRAQRRLCNVLRRSGQRIIYVPPRIMEARLRAGLDPYTGRLARGPAGASSGWARRSRCRPTPTTRRPSWAG